MSYLVLLIFLAFIQVRDVKAAPSELSQLNSLALQCFRYRKTVSCERALELAEALQRLAEEQKNYSCQTNALGLGANLLMSQMDVERGKKSIESLELVNRVCPNN